MDDGLGKNTSITDVCVDNGCIYIKKLFFGQLSISMYHACRSVVNPPDCCRLLVYLAASKLKTTATTTFAVFIAHEGFRVNMLKSYNIIRAYIIPISDRGHGNE